MIKNKGYYDALMTLKSSKNKQKMMTKIKISFFIERFI